MIVGKNITQAYKDTNILDNVDIKIKDNVITSIIGANGTGKSTLLGVLTRLLQMKKGDVFLDDVNMKSLKSIDIAKNLAILRQTNSINIKITIRELVSYGRYPHSKGNLKEEDNRIIDRFIEYMDLREIESKYIDEVSGGQRQRAYIAMILAQDTKYIFLDEPLNNLDMKYSSEIMMILRKLVVELNKTIVIVVHDINIASSYTDYIVAMKDGKIYKEGLPEEVINKEVLDEVFDHQFIIEEVNGKKICVYK